MLRFDWDPEKADSNLKKHGVRFAEDFREGVRGKDAARFAEGSNVIVLDPDVAEVFRDAKAVNEALRFLARSARESQRAS